ncbi:hypothetical protein GCM10022631_30390 [Deinococcus rubellus]|uniref:GGDEF domain-containing protein n=1 Tax=Deinococcus rubellus TaxID=1889240 RepID=A0ABY5YH38_9DEIO|nr:hypothetical protein [Deinococcus rubellus]UWX63594.1 hypothetical protein N0D28_12725 [Deinococcus rubellus]
MVALTKSDALGLAEQLRRDIQASQWAGLRVTVSLGVAAYRSGESAASLPALPGGFTQQSAPGATPCAEPSSRVLGRWTGSSGTRAHRS